MHESLLKLRVGYVKLLFKIHTNIDDVDVKSQ